MPGDEIARSIVRIAGASGSTLGTGFFVSARGDVLTCDHVIAAADTVLVETEAHVTKAVGRGRIVRFRELDVALIQTSLTPPGVVPLSMARSLRGVKFSTKGFQYGSMGVTGAFPLSGTVSDVTSIRYKLGTVLYSHPEVAVLPQVSIDHGLSGAPLADADSGVVIGIVLARLPDTVREGGGFALPLSALAAQHRLAKMVQHNSEQVPAFGTLGNVLGLRKIAGFQAGQSLETLVRSRLYLPRYSIARQDLCAKIRAFLGSGARVFPFVGHSGTGKTFALASLVSEMLAGHTVLLLRGALLLPTESDLRSAAARALDAAARSMNHPVIPPERWSIFLKEQRKHLLILLDGLNEVPNLLRQDVEGWLLKSFEWLKDAPAKWILSCRPEFWDQIASLFASAPVRVSLETPEKGSTAQPFRMADFSDAEASVALRAYSLGNAGVTPDEVRHPFLMRMYWEVAASHGEGLAENLSRYAVFERFLHSKVEKVALRASSPASVVRHLLAKAAKICLAAKSYELSFDRYYGSDLFHERAVGNQLVEEHVFLETEKGYRFSFDEIAEFLQAQSIDPVALCDPGELERMTNGRDTIALNAISFALLRLEHEGEIAAVRKCMASLMSFYGPGHQSVFLVILRSLAWLERPVDIFDLIESFSARLPVHELEEMLENVRLPLPEMFRLMHILATHEHHFLWEPKHWHMPAEKGFGLTSTFAQFVRRDARSAFGQLEQWLGDAAHLADGGFTTVADVATGLMFRYRAYDFDFVCDLLAARADATSGQFFSRMAEHAPEELLPLVDRWIGTRDGLERAAHCLDLLHRSGGLPDRALVDGARRLLAAASSPRARSQALEILSRFPGAVSESFGDVIAAIDAGDPVLNSPYILVRFLEARFDDTMRAIEARFLNNTRQREEAIGALSRFSGLPSQRGRVVALVRRIWEQDRAVTLAAAYFIESRCYREARDTPIFQNLMHLGTDLCESAASDARRFLIYAATAENYGEQQMQLVDALVRVETEEDNLRLLASELARMTGAVPSAWRRLDRLGRKLGEEGARLLLWEDHCAELLARWVREAVIKPVAEQAVVFAEALRAGKNPTKSMKAAQAFMRAHSRASGTRPIRKKSNG